MAPFCVNTLESNSSTQLTVTTYFAESLMWYRLQVTKNICEPWDEVKSSECFCAELLHYIAKIPWLAMPLKFVQLREARSFKEFTSRCLELSLKRGSQLRGLLHQVMNRGFKLLA